MIWFANTGFKYSANSDRPEVITQVSPTRKKNKGQYMEDLDPMEFIMM